MSEGWTLLPGAWRPTVGAAVEQRAENVSRIIWRAGFGFSIFLLGCAVMLATGGKIEYHYHLGRDRVTRIVQRAHEPGMFWGIVGAVATGGILGATVTARRLRKLPGRGQGQAPAPENGAGAAR